VFYAFLKIWLKIALKFYLNLSKKNKFEFQNIDKPSILAVNHPNSFLDALIVCAYHPKQIYFLARGDAFNKRWSNWILRKLHIIPIHRKEEGIENLHRNKQSFQEVMDVFKQDGHVLIFPEGICKNTNAIRPLRKGAARLAYLAWKQNNNTNLQVQAVRLRYSNFGLVPIEVELQTPSPMLAENYNLDNEAKFYRNFNESLVKKLEQETKNQSIPSNSTSLKKLLLFIPSLIGYVLNKPIIYLFQKLIKAKTKDTVFHDSVLFSSLMLLYPILIISIATLIWLLTHNSLYLLIIVFMPLSAYFYKRFKEIKQHSKG